ncbi:MAG: hypothetical protein AAF961_10525, partial [Planctomycetota bacterium]
MLCFIKMRFLFVLIVAVARFAAAAPTNAAEAAFRAGAATSNITPPLGISLNGGMSDRAATHIHDELHARCFVLDDGTRRLGFAICDSCMIPRAIHEAAKHLVHIHANLP